MARASLIIPTLERHEVLLTVLASLAQQTSQEFDTIVIDQSDAVNEEAEARAAASSGRIVYVHEKRKSLPNARNLGATKANTEVLIFIDDDVELAPEFVEAHLQHYQGNGSADAVAGRITGAYDDGPSDATVVGTFNPWLAKVTRNFHVTFPVDSIDQLPGGNFSVRKDVYLELGGFHPNTFGGPASIGEESDFACRLRAAGHKIIFDPRAHLVHLHAPRGGCRDESALRWTYWHGHNMAVLSRRHARAIAWLPFIWMQTLRYLVHALKGLNPFLWVAGCLGTLQGFMVGGRAEQTRLEEKQ